MQDPEPWIVRAVLEIHSVPMEGRGRACGVGMADERAVA